MTTYLEYKDEKSHKFWEIEVKENNHTVRYGKIGTDGRETSKEFDSEEAALKDAQKQINAKKKKGYVEATSSTLTTPSTPPKTPKASHKSEQKPVKIRQPLLENPAYAFEYEKNPPQNPEGKFMSFDEANSKYKIEGGQLANFVTKAFVLDGDVYIKSDEEAQKIVDQAHKDDYSVLIIITGNLTYEDWLGAPFSPLMVCGDVRCDGVGAGDENDTTVKGNIYAKQAFWLSGSDCCFACMGKVYTPYFLTDGNDINVSITLAKGYIGIEDNSEAYESEMDYKVHYTGKHYKTSFVYEVLDFGFELDAEKFIDYVASGKNPIREFERTKQEITQDKKRKANDSLNDVLSDKIKNTDKQLDLSDSKLQDVPEVVCTLEKLEELDLSGNKIKKLPKEIGRLKNLRKLDVSHNNAINIDAICELENLELLNINSCALPWASEKLFKLPLKFRRLKNLKTLFADAGNTYFANPEQIADLENLENLEIAWYYVLETADEYIPQIKTMKKLKRLIIYEKFYDKQDMETIKNTFSHCEILFAKEGQYYLPETKKTTNFKILGLSAKYIEQAGQSDEDYKKLIQFVDIFREGRK